MPEVSSTYINPEFLSYDVGNGLFLDVSLYQSPANNNHTRISFDLHNKGGPLSLTIINLTGLELRSLRSLMAGDKGFPIWLALRKQAGPDLSAFIHQMEKLITISDLWGGISQENLKAILKLLKGE